ncbi:alpha-N-acetylgalactosamine-specific lectin-like [Antedon mediterranea]|uniref:alpha-N-acetylgalactosamine-specific lectin-like n=1 Tax=Antedon mediterranea TaxID=105859 RepID=UPI003AF64CAD
MGVSGNSTCQCDLFWVPFQQSCYRGFGHLVTWSQARAECKRHRAHLVSIGSAFENWFVYELWKSSTGNKIAATGITFWTGLNDIDQEGIYKWADSSESVVWYRNWKLNQPDNSRNEDCVHLEPTSGRWNDLNCGAHAYYMCEMRQ